VKTTRAIILAAIAATGGALSTGLAHADPTAVAVASSTNLHALGSPTQLGDGTWTVTNLKPSSDTIGWHLDGTLWEATATDEATHGSTTPVVSNFNARARSGQTYRELFQVPSAQGVNPSGLAQGQQTTGKLYFDVTGDAPDSVIYNAGGPDLAVWVQPPPTTGAGSAAGAGHAAVAAGAPAPGAAGLSPSAAAPTALPASHAGSVGTPLPGGAQGTTAPASVPGGPQAPSAGTPAPAAPQTPAPGAPQTPAPGAPQPPPAQGSQGTPLEPGTEPTPTQAPGPQQPLTAPASAAVTPGSAPS
jgi:hypothetical protein